MATSYPLTLLALLILSSPSYASREIPVGYQRVAQQAGIPPDVLYAVALTESGTRVAQVTRPWPWTLNVAGKGYRYASQQEACRALYRFMRTTHPRRIDAGLGQINLGWNGQFFTAPCDVLAPYPNLRVTARLLRQHYDRWQNWYEAIGRYHRPAGGEPARRYRQKVLRYLQRTG